MVWKNWLCLDIGKKYCTPWKLKDFYTWFRKPLIKRQSFYLSYVHLCVIKIGENMHKNGPPLTFMVVHLQIFTSRGFIFNLKAYSPPSGRQSILHIPSHFERWWSTAQMLRKNQAPCNTWTPWISVGESTADQSPAAIIISACETWIKLEELTYEDLWGHWL